MRAEYISAQNGRVVCRWTTVPENVVLYVLNDIPFGIGCGLIMDGNLYRGKQGAAGEFFLKSLHQQRYGGGAHEFDAVVDRRDLRSTAG